MLSEISQMKKDVDHMVPLLNRYLVKFIKMQSRKVVARNWKKGRMGYYFLRGSISILQHEKVLEIALQCECTNATELCA